MSFSNKIINVLPTEDFCFSFFVLQISLIELFEDVGHL